jgi:hypothetical protein
MSDKNEGRQWIVEPPPARGELSLLVACGDGVELNAEQEAALSELLRTLEVGDAEVVGHSGCVKVSFCEGYSYCDKLSCGKVSCGALACALTKTTSTALTSGGGSWALTGSFGLRSV